MVLLAFPDVQVLDVTGPIEVMAMANRLGAAPVYEIEVVTGSGGPVRASCGLTMLADRATGECRGAIDTLVVAGGLGTAAAAGDERLTAWVRSAARRSRRVASVCTGAFLLAGAGLHR